MRQLQIQVFQSMDSRRENKVLFERVVDINDSLDLPFTRLLDSLKFMYGVSSIVQFSVI